VVDFGSRLKIARDVCKMAVLDRLVIRETLF
jgi:hypothetical protein